MPVLSKGSLPGSRIIPMTGKVSLSYSFHSSVSANRQWRPLTDALKDRTDPRDQPVRLRETTPWSGTSPQSLYAKAQLVLALCDEGWTPVHLVGHSFGGSVALKAASLLGPRVGRLILLEPNPFYLLRQHGRVQAFLESRTLRDHVKCFGSLGDWPTLGALCRVLARRWTWSTMPEKRRANFVDSLRPNFYEWDAVHGRRNYGCE